MSFCPMQALQASSPQGRKELDEDAMKQRWRRKRPFLYVKERRNFLGQDADYVSECNPSAIMYEEVFLVCLEQSGKVYHHFKKWETFAEAQSFLEKVEVAVVNGQSLDMAHWSCQRGTR